MRAQRPQPLTIDAHSFLPGLSLFTPSTAGQSSFQTPMTSNHCSTILEEDDSDVESTRLISPTAPSKRTSNSMPLCPRVLRVADDSQSDDEFSEHAVLRFPAPPAAVPANKFNSKPLQPPPRSHSLRLRTIPEPMKQLKSCFEDDSPTDLLFTRRSSRSASATPTVERAVKPSSVKSPLSRPEPYFSVYPSRKYAGRGPSPPPEKPLPSLPNTSPAPSLTSSDSSTLSTSPAPSYIPSSSIVPAPLATSARDVDEYLDTLSAYFPPDVWTWHDDASIVPASTEILTRSRSKSSLRQTQLDHARNESTDSILSVSDNASDTSYSTCSTSFSSSKLRTSASVADLSSSSKSTKARNVRLSDVTSPTSNRPSSPSLLLRIDITGTSSNSRSSSPIAERGYGSNTPSHPPHQIHPKSILKSSKSTSALRHERPPTSPPKSILPQPSLPSSSYPSRPSSSCGSLRATAAPKHPYSALSSIDVAPL